MCFRLDQSLIITISWSVEWEALVLRNIPARKDFRHGNLRLFRLNHRLLIGLIGLKIRLTVNYQQIVLSLAGIRK